MKRNIILAIAAMFTLSIGAAVYAFNSTTITTATTASCCCKGDSCPMKKDGKASADAKESCCKDDCCKGDSCPMKKGDAAKADGATATEHSCPMMKEGKMADHHAEMKHDGEGCSCLCCSHAKAKTDTPSV
ncbi:MAG TPA: hypothetical protein PKA82_02555 [Pyrinomonadaceae bacterium]|nr:hypothetical protein [Pyrinomonadaceae bacterium]